MTRFAKKESQKVLTIDQSVVRVTELAKAVSGMTELQAENVSRDMKNVEFTLAGTILNVLTVINKIMVVVDVEGTSIFISAFFSKKWSSVLLSLNKKDRIWFQGKVRSVREGSVSFDECTLLSERLVPPETPSS